MAGESLVGKNCKVALGATKVLGIGSWSMDGQTRAEIDDTEFGDEYAKFKFSVINGGAITFAGNYKKDDVTGQDALDDFFDQATDLTSLRLYVDNTSYYEPCQTTSYLRPNNTSTANTKLSYVNITAKPITADKGALMGISFTAKISGQMVLI